MCLKCGYRHIISNPKEYWSWTSNGEEMLINVPETSNTQQGSSTRPHMKYEEQFNLIDDMIGNVFRVNGTYDE